MTNEELRKSICSQLKTVDSSTLKMIYAMLKEYHAPEEDDEKELVRELQRISKAHKTGKSPSFAAEDAIEYVRKNRKTNRK